MWAFRTYTLIESICFSLVILVVLSKLKSNSLGLILILQIWVKVGFLGSFDYWLLWSLNQIILNIPLDCLIKQDGLLTYYSKGLTQVG